MHTTVPNTLGDGGPPPHQPAVRWQLKGLIAALLLVVAGVIVVTVAYHLAKTSNSFGHFHLYWLGALLGMAGLVLGTALQDTPRLQQFGMLVLAAIFTFLPKFLISPNGAIFFDEFGHWQHAKDIAAGAGLGTPVNFQPIVPSYPVLEVLTAAIHFVTRLSVWHSGQVLVLGCHVLMLFTLRAIALHCGISARAANFGALIYAAGANFQFFDAQFAYESIGLPFAFFTALCVIKAKSAVTMRTRLIWSTASVGSAAVTTLSHHISAIVMVLLVVLIAVFWPTARVATDRRRTPRRADVALFSAVPVVSALFVVIWFLATPTRQYLQGGFRNALNGLTSLVGGASNSGGSGDGGATTTVRASSNHTPFAGGALPGYEKIMGYGAPVLAVLAFLFACYLLFRRRSSSELRKFVPFAILGALYFLSLPAVLSASSGQAVHRSWSFTWAGVAILCAVSFEALVERRGTARPAKSSVRAALSLAAVGWLFLVMLGEVAAGSSSYTRFPGPERFGQDARFGNSNLSAVVSWAGDNLPARSHVVTDRFTSQRLTGYTDLQVPSPAQSGVYGLYRSGGSPWSGLSATLAAGNFDYWILDTRIVTQLPYFSFFQSYRGYANSVNPAALRSIHDNQFLTLIHTTGQYRVYQLRPTLG